MSAAPASSAVSKPQTLAKRPSEAEITAKRAARAAKKEAAEAEARRKAAEGEVGMQPSVDSQGRPLYLRREWEKVQGAPSNRRGVRIFSWNMLAQGLVRRKLFPGSDCLKWRDREAGLSAELCANGWDVGAFQEVDRIDSHGTTLRKAGYEYIYSKGYPQKAHGLLIAWRSAPRRLADGSLSVCFRKEPLSQRTVFLDDCPVSQQDETLSRSGGANPSSVCCSRETRNVALFAALRLKSNAEANGTEAGPAQEGVIIATTHLFWHPMHAYERVRQSGILVRELERFRREQGAECRHWPTILAGDFNDQPHSATYQLLTGQALTQESIGEILRSTVVHQSIDQKAKRRAEAAAAASASEAQADERVPHGGSDDAEEPGEENEEDEEGEDEEGGSDDQMLKNCRIAEPGELLTVSELYQLHDLSRPPPRSGKDDNPTSCGSDGAFKRPLRSTYGSAYARTNASEANTFSHVTRGRERWDDEEWVDGTPNPHAGVQTGRDEPMWTIFSSLFSLTLDYILLLPSMDETQDQQVYLPVLSLLPTHKTEVLRPGIPRLGICASDHLAIGAEIGL